MQCLYAIDPAHFIGSITADQTSVYFHASGQTANKSYVMKVPRRGGEAVTLFQAYPFFLVTDGAALFWSDIGGASGYSIKRISVNGGPAETIASTSIYGCLAVDSSDIYWSDTDYTANESLVLKAPKVGGSVVTLATAPLDPLNVPAPVLVDSTSVYWAPGSVFKINKVGGSLVTIAPTDTFPNAGAQGFEPNCRAIALSNGSLFMVNEVNSSGAIEIVGAPISGTGQAKVVDAGDTPMDLVSGPNMLFWSGLGTNLDINETPFDGGPTQVIAMPLTYTLSDIFLTSDGTLYWAIPGQIQSMVP